MYLIFDTETTGLPQNFNAPLSDSDNWPRMVQIAWQLHDENGELIENQDYIIKPEGYDIPFNATRIHGISTKMAQEQGRDLQKSVPSSIVSAESVFSNVFSIPFRKSSAPTIL